MHANAWDCCSILNLVALNDELKSRRNCTLNISLQPWLHNAMDKCSFFFFLIKFSINYEQVKELNEQKQQMEKMVCTDQNERKTLLSNMWFLWALIISVFRLQQQRVKTPSSMRTWWWNKPVTTASPLPRMLCCSCFDSMLVTSLTRGNW